MTTPTNHPSRRRPVIVALNRQAARAAISAAVARFTSLLEQTGDIGRPAADLDWTIAETAAHVYVVMTGLTAAIAGEPQALQPENYIEADFPTRLAASNAATLARVEHTDARRLAESISTAAQQFLNTLTAADPEATCETPWYGPGRTRTVDCLTALALAELIVHGYDIARATRRPWPISSEEAKLIVGTVCPEMSPLLARPESGRDAPMTYEIRLRDGGPRYVIRVADGTAQASAPGGAVVDCVISADPVTYLLVVYGRMPVWRAVLHGEIVAWGRRPWLGLRFKSLFFNP